MAHAELPRVLVLSFLHGGGRAAEEATRSAWINDIGRVVFGPLAPPASGEDRRRCERDCVEHVEAGRVLVHGDTVGRTIDVLGPIRACRAVAPLMQVDSENQR